MYQIQYLPFTGPAKWLLAREVRDSSATLHISDAKAVVLINTYGSVVRILSGRYTKEDPQPYWLPQKTARWP